MAKEYIEREAATAYAPLPKYLRDYQTMNLDDAWDDGYDFAIRQLSSIPAADVIEVVRCGECEYWDTTWNPKAAKNGEHYCPATDLFTTPDWFCADGERREVQDDN